MRFIANGSYKTIPNIVVHIMIINPILFTSHCFMKCESRKYIVLRFLIVTLFLIPPHSKHYFPTRKLQSDDVILFCLAQATSCNPYTYS